MDCRRRAGEGAQLSNSFHRDTSGALPFSLQKPPRTAIEQLLYSDSELLAVLSKPDAFGTKRLLFKKGRSIFFTPVTGEWFDPAHGASAFKIEEPSGLAEILERLRGSHPDKKQFQISLYEDVVEAEEAV